MQAICYTGRMNFEADISKTAFGRWLAERDDRPYLFARRLHISRDMVNWLAGHPKIRHQRGTERRLALDVVEAVSRETGIAVGTLIDEALAAQRDLDLQAAE